MFRKSIKNINYFFAVTICTMNTGFALEAEDVDQRVKEIAATKFITELLTKVADPTLQSALNVADMVAYFGEYGQPKVTIENIYSQLGQVTGDLDTLRDTLNSGGKIIDDLDVILSTAGPFLDLGTSTYSLMQNWSKVVDSEGNMGSRTEAGAFGLLDTYNTAKAVVDSSKVIINALPAGVKTKVVGVISKSSFGKAVQKTAGQAAKAAGPLLAGVSTAQLVGEIFNAKRSDIIDETLRYKGSEYSANVVIRDIVLGRIYEKFTQRELANEVLTRDDITSELAILSNLSVNITKIHTLGKSYSATKFFDEILANEAQLERAFCRDEMNTAACRTEISSATLKNWQKVYLSIYSVAEFASVEDDEIIGYLECLTGYASEASYDCSNVHNNNFADIIFSPFLGSSVFEYKDVIRDVIEFTFPYQRINVISKDIFGTNRSSAVGFYNALYFMAFENQRAETESALAYQIGKTIEELSAKRQKQRAAEEFKEATVATLFTPLDVEFNQENSTITAELDTTMLLQLTPEFIHSYFEYNNAPNHFEKIKTGEYPVTLYYNTANQIGSVSASYDTEKYGLNFIGNTADAFKLTRLNYTIPDTILGDRQYTVDLNDNLLRKFFPIVPADIERPLGCPSTATDIACVVGSHIAYSFDMSGSAADITIEGNYAYVAAGGGIQVIDISNPANLAIVSFIGTPGSVKDIAIAGNYAYIADGGSGLQIVDISNSLTPVIIGSIDTPGNALGVTITGSYVYMADDGSGLQIIDISNPTNPVITGNIRQPGNVLDVAIAGNYAYTANYSFGNNFHSSLGVIDISNRANPVSLSSVNIPDRALAVSIKGNHAYIAALSRLQVVDISTPSNPLIIGSVKTPGGALGVSIQGNYAYLPVRSKGLQLVDIGNPTNPLTTGNIDTDNAYDVAVAGNYAFITNSSSNVLQVADISNPSLDNSAIVSSYDMPFTNRLAISGNYAYIIASSHGLYVVDIRNPANPIIVGSVDPTNANQTSNGIAVAGNYAYISNNQSNDTNAAYNGITVVDISNPTNPTIVGVGNIRAATHIVVKENHAYISTGNRFFAVDISNPANPIIMEDYIYLDSIRGITIAGNYAYIATYRHGGSDTQVVDISNPANMILTDSFNISTGPGFNANNTAISGNYAYMNLHNPTIANTIQVIDINGPPTRYNKGTTLPLVYPGVLQISGNHLYSANAVNGLQMVDISDPLNPLTSGNVNLPGAINDFKIAGNYAYVAAGHDGLQVFDITQAKNYYQLINDYYGPDITSIDLISESPFDYDFSTQALTKTWTFSEDIAALNVDVLSSNFSSVGTINKNGNVITLSLRPDTTVPINRIDLKLTDADGDQVLIGGSVTFWAIVRTNYQPDFSANQITQMVSNFIEPAFLKMETFDADGDNVSITITDNDGGYVLFDPDNANRLVASFSDSEPVHTIKVALSDGKETVEKELTVLRFNATTVGSFYDDVPSNHTYRKDIAFATLQAIIAGQPDPTDITQRIYRPDDSATWAEALKIIVNAATKAGFVQNSDIANPISTQPKWATPYYNTALALNAIEIKGNDLGALSPTREQIAKLLVKLLEFDVLIDDIDNIAFDFSDPDSFSDYRYRWYGEVAHVFGVFMSGNTANAQDTATRGELARVAARIFSIPKGEVSISSFEFGTNFDIPAPTIEANIINDGLSVVDNSANVDVAYAINWQRLDDNEVPVSRTQKGSNDLIIALTNDGVSNIIRQPLTSSSSDTDNDGVLDNNDAWINDARYSQDINQNGIPDILDSIYGLIELTPQDTIVINGVIILVSDLINQGACQEGELPAYNSSTYEITTIDSYCDLPDGWIVGEIPDEIPDSDNDGVKDDEDCSILDETKWTLIDVYLDADADGFGSGSVSEICIGSNLPVTHSINNTDNCPDIANSNQLDTDDDGFGNVCDIDDDGDNVLDEVDNCPLLANSNQVDENSNEVGDACEVEDCNFYIIGKIIICL